MHKTNFKKVLSVFLSFLMILSCWVWVAPDTHTHAEAAGYAVEYYYSSGTTFLTDLAVSARQYQFLAGGRADAAKGYLTNAGYTVLNQDLNAGKNSYFTFMGYKMGTDESKAIRAFGLYNSPGDAPSSLSYTIDGRACTFYPVTTSFVDSGTSTGNVLDLNKGCGGGTDTIYLYYSTDPNAGQLITKIDWQDGTTNDQADVQTPVVWLNTNGDRKAGDIADFNRGVSGSDDIFFFYNRIGTQVTTTELRTAVDAAKVKLDNKSNYTDATIETLQKAYNTGKAIVDDYNSYGLSGAYDQNAIDSAKNAINNAINALRTTATLNFNYTGSSPDVPIEYEVGAATTYTYAVHDFVGERAGYTFTGWSTSSSATSGSKSTVTAGLKPTFYAIWQANKYNVLFDNLIDYNEWKSMITSDKANAISLVEGGFAITNTKDEGEFTFASPFFPVDPGKQYKIDINFEGVAWDVYIFFCDANGTWIDFADGPTNRFSAGATTGIPADNAVFTAPDKSEVVKAQIRLDSNNPGGKVTFSNIRVYEVNSVENGVSYTDPVTVTYDSTYGTLPSPTRDGYEFLGWYDANGTKVNSSDTVKITADTTLYSRWKQLGYTITWVDGNGATLKTELVNKGVTPSYSGSTPTKQVDATNHYIFNGKWSPAVVAASANATYTAQFDAVAHTFTWTTITPATCIAAGAKKGVCSYCGYETTAEIPATNTHSYTVFVETVAPSCTAGGYDTYKCATCDAKQKRNETSATPHTAATREENRVEATCAVPGSYVLVTYCSKCNNELNRENKIIPATNAHSYTVFVNKVESTCTTDGYDVYKCATCNATQNQNIVAAHHTLTTVAAKPATCGEDGWNAYEYCTECTHTTKVTIPATGAHVYEYAQNADKKTHTGTCTGCGATTSGICAGDNATCTDDAICNTCNSVYQGKLGHSFTDYKSNGDATCTADGTKTAKCDRCDAKETVTDKGSAKGHTWQDADCTTPKTCSVCGATEGEELGHSFTDYKSNGDATCTADGTKTAKCDRCTVTSTVTDTGSAKGHTPAAAVEENIVKASCTAAGSYDSVVYCSISTCKAEISRTEQTIAKREHVYGDEWEVVTPPTHTTEGLEKKTCTREADKYYEACSHEITQVIPVVTDTTAPEVTLTIDESTWNKFLTAISFGTYVSKELQLEIEASDAETDIKSIEYYISATALTEEEVKAVTEWTAYEGKVAISRADAAKMVVYVKAVNGQNVAAYVSSDGYTFDLSKPVITVEKNCTTAIITVTETNLDTVKVDDAAVTLTDGAYTIEGAGTYVVVAADKAGNTTTETITINGHQEKILDAKEETCTTTGLTEGKICSVCNTVLLKQNTIDATGHSFVNEVEANDATCTADGNKAYKQCENCNKFFAAAEGEYSENAKDSADAFVIASPGHDFADEFTVDLKATCDTAGSKSRHCSACDEVTDTTEIPVRAHTIVDTTVATAATCTVDGVMNQKCSNEATDEYEACAYTTTRVIPATGHTEITLDAVDSTCTETGLTEGKKCTVCGTVTVKQEVTEKLGHNHVATVTDPTCNDRGFTTHVCSRCNDTYVDTYVDALGHNYSTENATDNNNGTHTLACTRCAEGTTGHFEIVACEYKDVETAPSCTAQGYTTHICTVCGYSYADTYVSATGHTWGKWTVAGNGTHTRECTVCQNEAGRTETAACTYGDWTQTVAPKCEEDGEKAHTCTVCNDTVTAVVPQTGHAWDDGVITEASSCTVAGTITYTCQNDNSHTYTEDAPLAPHDWMGADCNNPSTCRACGAASGSAIGHTFTNFVETVDYTCTEQGYTVYDCIRCEETEKRDFVDPAHRFAEAFTIDDAATCDKDGLKSRHCTECTAVIDETVIKARGHKLVDTTVAIAATCKETGIMNQACSNTATDEYEACAYTTTRVIDIDPEAHNWEDNYTVDTKATCEANGTKTIHCEYCDTKKPASAVVINKRDHVYAENGVAIPATCTADGVMNLICTNDETEEYAQCRHESTTAISATGHIFGTVTAATEATCTTAGNSAYKQCANCSKFFAADADNKSTAAKDSAEAFTIKALDHDFAESFTVDKKATCEENGSKSRHCSRCSAVTEVTVISKRAHNYVDTSVAQDATCTAEGVMNTICTNVETDTHEACSDVSTRVIEIKPDAHSFTAYISDNNATCYSNCTETATCDNGCGNTDTKEIADSKAAHNYTGYVANGDATCQKNGTETGTCSFGCGAKDTRVIENSTVGHKFTSYTGKGDATCQKNETETASCDYGCGQTNSREIANSTVPHNYVDYTENNDATCQRNETETASCSFGCGQTHTREIADSTVPHNYVDYTENNDATCQRNETETASCEYGCGTTDTRDIANSKVEHKFESYTANGEATCKDNDTETASCAYGCGQTHTREIADSTVGHKFTSYTGNGDATCSKNETETAFCDYGCGQTNSREIADSTVPHNYVDYIENNDATCQRNETETASCSFGCGETHTREIADSKVAHNYVNYVANNDATCQKNRTETGTCSYGCGATDTRDIADSKVEHKFESYTANGEATCQDNDTETASCAYGCGQTHTREIADSTVDHKYETYVSNNNATCKDNATETASCEYGCGATDTRVIANSTVPHNYVDYTENNDATCQRNETETASCAFGCGQTHTREIANSKVGHNFETYTGNGDATCQRNETETAACAYGCGATDTREIADSKADHTRVEIPAVAATCQATGLTAGVKCSVCSTILVEQTVTAKTDHAEVIDAAVAPGCETTGLTEGKHCSFCGTVIKAQTTVNATGHDFDMSKATLTRPTQKANGTWTDGYYSYTCKNDKSHTKQETVKRADYAAYDAIIESVNTLLKEDLPEEDIIKLQKLLNNTIAQNLIADEQANVDAEVEKINDVITAVYPDAGLSLVIRGADTFYAGTVIDLSVFKVNENISIEATNVNWTCSEENTVFFANGRLLAVSTGTVTLTAKSGLLTATKTINIVEGGNVRIIRFNAMNQMHYIIEDSFAVYNSGNLYWSNDHDIRFRVYTNSSFTFETHMVYLNGVAVEPDAQGYYTIPAGVGDVRVNVAGAVYDEDDEGNRTKFNFWEWLVALFRRIINFFKSIFGIA